MLCRLRSRIRTGASVNQARTRTYLGAAAVVASVFAPQQCGLYDYNCRRLEGANCRRDWWAPQVVDVEGRTLKLTGTAEEQYREWRKLLHEMSYD